MQMQKNTKEPYRFQIRIIKFYFFNYIRKSTLKVKIMLYFIQAKMMASFLKKQSGPRIHEAL
jgi:hypothetical protein